MYVHVPWCRTRCGYCDFNTYLPGTLGPEVLGTASPATFAADAIAEVMFARRVLGHRDLPVSTVFFGGGTPTLLPAGDLAAVLGAIDSEFGLVPGAEVTTEANPESVTQESLAALRAGGFTRISLGMQSAVPHVLAVLDRVHTPGRPVEAARWARDAGFDQVSLDLIYGAPGESDADWRESVDTACGAEPNHVSAYSLTVEPGTRMAAQVARGELPAPDDDVLADRYEIADDLLSAAGLNWYETSNWSRPGGQCRHNLGYWHSDDWWGIGPGAHSHIGGVRWWNVKNPTSYAARLAAGMSPGAGREILDPSARLTEQLLLKIRLATGLAVTEIGIAAQGELPGLIREGLVWPDLAANGSIVLTLRGRLLADLVAHRLTP